MEWRGKRLNEWRKGKKEIEWDRIIKSETLKCGWIELAKSKFQWHDLIQMNINFAKKDLFQDTFSNYVSYIFKK